MVPPPHSLNFFLCVVSSMNQQSPNPFFNPDRYGDVHNGVPKDQPPVLQPRVPYHPPKSHGRFDVSNRPAGDTTIRAEFSYEVLQELVIQFLMIAQGETVTDEGKERLLTSLNTLLNQTRPKYKGHHPRDVTYLEGEMAETLSLPECLNNLRIMLRPYMDRG